MLKIYYLFSNIYDVLFLGTFAIIILVKLYVMIWHTNEYVSCVMALISIKKTTNKPII